MADIFHIEIADSAKKDLRKIPKNIVGKLLTWVGLVTEFGVTEARKIKSYHDEPLKGKRSHQRSIRLNSSYRAIYEIKDDEIKIQYIEIQEVNKHEY